MRRIVLGIAAAVTTFAPAAVQADDQQIADFIRNKLQVEQREGNLRGFNVDLRVDRGTVWFDGNVSNAEQEALILRTAQSAGYLGVVQVVDDIEIAQPVTPQAPERAIPAIVPGPSAASAASLQTPLGVQAQQPNTAQQVQYQQQPPAPTRFAQAGSGTRNFAPAAQDYAAPVVTGEVYGTPAEYGVPTEYGVPSEWRTVWRRVHLWWRAHAIRFMRWGILRSTSPRWSGRRKLRCSSQWTTSPCWLRRWSRWSERSSELARLRMARIRSQSKLRSGKLSQAVFCVSMALHRSILPVPTSSSWLA